MFPGKISKCPDSRSNFWPCPETAFVRVVTPRFERTRESLSLPLDPAYSRSFSAVFSASRLYDGPQETRCKQKTIAANKKDALQTKNDRCKQKTCAANKKRSLQTKNMRSKQKTLWLCGRYKPVKVFKILNGRQSGIFNKFHQSINPS